MKNYKDNLDHTLLDNIKNIGLISILFIFLLIFVFIVFAFFDDPDGTIKLLF